MSNVITFLLSNSGMVFYSIWKFSHTPSLILYISIRVCFFAIGMSTWYLCSTLECLTSLGKKSITVVSSLLYIRAHLHLMSILAGKHIVASERLQPICYYAVFQAPSIQSIRGNDCYWTKRLWCRFTENRYLCHLLICCVFFVTDLTTQVISTAILGESMLV